jgi:hypothetical protein
LFSGKIKDVTTTEEISVADIPTLIKNHFIELVLWEGESS